MSVQTLTVRVDSRTQQSVDIVSIELGAISEPLPQFTAGAHIDVHLANGQIRQYSIMNDQEERNRYVIAVQRQKASRGGSSFVHDVLAEGATLTISAPRNHFPLVEHAPHTILIGGGIGVTPLLSMAARLVSLGRSWELVYCARTRDHAVARDTLAAYGAHVRYNFDQEPGSVMLDIAAVVAGAPDGTHFYCCGPTPMLATFEIAMHARPGFGHVEYFAAKPTDSTDAPRDDRAFDVRLVRSGITLRVEADRSILDTLIDAHFDLPYSCQEGVCGSCETAVLDGEVDHRDFVLSDAEKASSKSMMICCSRCNGERLVLDL